MMGPDESLLLADPFPEAKPEQPNDEGLERIGCVFGGVVDDYRRRSKLYVSDFKDAWTHKTVSSALFMFFATFASTVALGVVIKRNTECSNASGDTCTEGSYIGVTEYLLANSVAGMAHALFGCQPLLVLRPTGPITAFLTLLFNVSKSLNLDYLEFLAWTGIFVGTYMVFVAAFELSRFIKLLTRFLHDIFAFFVCSIYIVDGIQGTLKRFTDDKAQNHADDDKSICEALFASILVCVLLAVAFTLHGMRKSKLFTRKFNLFLVDYSLTIATIVCILASYLARGAIYVERIDLPAVSGVGLQPTLSGRNWFTRLGSADMRTICVAAVAALPIAIFFFFDQNVSSLLCQKKETHMRKGSYFHSSFLCMALFNIVGPVLGLPFVTGSLPHSPQLVGALTVDRGLSDRQVQDGRGKRFHVHENRVSPFLMYMMIGVVLLFPFGREAIEHIPEAAVDGILIFVGVSGLFDCHLWARLKLLPVLAPPSGQAAAKPEMAPSSPAPQTIPLRRMHLFTCIQVLSLAFAWLLNGLAMGYTSLSFLGLLFPIIILLLVPFRIYVMPRIFTVEELHVLD